jgi:hypothetical protein
MDDLVIFSQKFPELRDNLSLVPFQIFMYFRDTEIAIGTAFFYLYSLPNKRAKKMIR